MSKIAFTEDGTVGHTSVNLSLIPTTLEKGYQASHIGSKNGIEREMVESQVSNIKYYSISSDKLRRYLSFENAKDVFRVLKGILDARCVLKKEKPDLLSSKGGSVSVPVVIAARSLNIPTIVHESNLIPGLTNKVSLRFSKKIYTTFEDTLKYLPKDRADFVGATIREDLKEGSQQEGHEITGLDSDKGVLLVMGGSLGNKKLNDIIRDNLEVLLYDYQIIHLTGHGLVDESYKQKRYIQYEFVKGELTHLLSITDTVVSRVDSNATCEFLALRIPMLLILLGLNQSRGDQIDNAKYSESKGYGKMIPEDQLIQFKLLEQLKQIEPHRDDIIHRMESYKESYTKEDLFNKTLNDALWYRRTN